ncbi:DEAD/DEAH box helicase [Streptomyces axinellae]|uniref:ATP-dependent helicase n=1 Tax=Streptomyces axinellae TaxID=552788 RepID=A0ABN3QKY8_9ACTN
MRQGSGADLLRCAVVFLPGEVPRSGRLAFWSPDGAEVPDEGEPGEPGELTVAQLCGRDVRRREVPARMLTVREALPLLMRARTAPGAHPSAACWGAAALHGLRLVAQGRLMPSVGEGDTDVWRAGPLDKSDAAHLRAIAAAMPGEGHAVPVRPASGGAGATAGGGEASDGAVVSGGKGGGGWGGAAGLDGVERAEAAVGAERADGVERADGAEAWVPEAEGLVRAFLDAVADTLPRTPAGPSVVGPAFAAREPQRLPERYPRVREWAAEVAAGQDAGIRISLRLDLSPRGLFDSGTDEEQEAGAGVRTDAGPEHRRGGREAEHGSGPGRPSGGSGPPSRAAALVQAHSVEDATLVADVGQLWRGEAAYLGPRARADTLLAIRRAARVWPPLERLLQRPVPDVLPLSEEELNDLLGRTARELAAADVAVHWPRNLARELDATAVVGPRRHAPGSAADGFGFFKEEHLLEFRWQLALEGDPLTEGEMDELAEAHRPLVRLRDQWVLVDPELVRKARKRHLGLLQPSAALAAALSGEAEIDGEPVAAVATGALAALRDRLTAQAKGGGERGGEGERANGEEDEGEDERAKEGAGVGGAGVEVPPAALRATLRGYQRRGLAWLDLMTSLGLGGCLADDMGLGKTVTLIALHLRRAERGETAPTLVVCPASLLGNWQREIARFAPGVPIRRYHGPGRSLEGLAERVEEPAGGLAGGHDGGAEEPEPSTGSAEPGEDEGRGIAAGTDGGEDGGRAGRGGAAAGFVLTTYATMRTSAAELAGRRWGLVVADEAQHVKNARSATARALRTLPSAARVALTGTPVENNLSELWALLDWTTPGLLGPLKTFRARHARAVEGGEDPEATQRLARLVGPFLLRRKKSDPGIVPELPPKTETDHPVALSREQASLYEAVVRETLAEIEAAKGIARRGLVMKLLTALKQICNHPAQYLREAADGRPRSREAATGQPGRSGKLELLDELLETILAEEGSVLVFTQYVEMAHLLAAHLGERGTRTQLLHGGTPVARREEMVDRFQSGEIPVFLLSLKAAGTGLNLARAGHVIHYDRWWNPAVEEQATDRAYRIGQTQPVQVHRLLTEGTVEDRIAQLLHSKRQLAEAVLSGGEAALTELSDAQLADLVSLRSEP